MPVSKLLFSANLKRKLRQQKAILGVAFLFIYLPERNKSDGADKSDRAACFDAG